MLRVCLFGIYDIVFILYINICYIYFVISIFYTLLCIFLLLDCLDSIWSQRFVDALVPERKEKIIAGRCAYASREEWKAEAKDRVF